MKILLLLLLTAVLLIESRIAAQITTTNKKLDMLGLELGRVAMDLEGQK